MIEGRAGWSGVEPQAQETGICVGRDYVAALSWDAWIRSCARVQPPHKYRGHSLQRAREIPGMPVMGRVQCWNFTSSIRGYFAACVTGNLAARWTASPATSQRRATSANQPRFISVGLAVSATIY